MSKAVITPGSHFYQGGVKYAKAWESYMPRRECRGSQNLGESLATTCMTPARTEFYKTYDPTTVYGKILPSLALRDPIINWMEIEKVWIYLHLYCVRIPIPLRSSLHVD